MLDKLGEAIPGLLGFVASGLVLGAALWAAYRVLLGNRPDLDPDKKLSRQLFMVFFALVALVLLTLALPVDETIRNQILSLIGIVLSGLVAFSSTAIVGNLMAGLMMRFTKPFRVGDFVQVEEFFGRVTETGLLDTEFQTEHRELIAFPNSYLISHPVTVTRSSGTIVSAQLSLGFDVHHLTIEKLLLEAVKKTELEDGFVQIIQIGDFSVSYRVSGLLTEVKSLISTRSRLLGHVLDTLHEAGVEILSPNFMAQRPQPDGLKMIPVASEKQAPVKKKHEESPESVIFDKAEEAEAVHEQIQTIQKSIQDLRDQRETCENAEKDRIDQELETLNERLEALQNSKNKDEGASSNH
ncbi:hypothetical protein GCM10007875_04750 [Limnobacter litoralis]|uniref:Small-conductance mechanosensitive channel n=1 Tax=Limnobacter litoralis TaxID=481366 RepID=A0ABQ5YPK8_9BURK|nr:hypothetical protein GCM10007875_04750 [Limnobacter litoralis]